VEEAIAIVESAAAVVLKSLEGCNKKALSNSPVLVHKRDLEVLKEMYDRGEVNNLGHLPNDFWTKQRKEAHYKKCVGGGGSTRGAQPMVGSARDEHVALCEAKGGIPMGPMAETELADHRAKQAEGLKKASTLLFRLANGKKDQEHKWGVTSRYYTTTSIHTFTNGFDDPIKGIRAFEDYLVDSYESEDLTEDGKLALAETIKKRNKSDKRKNKRANKKKRAN
jgi:hypothetical protein